MALQQTLEIQFEEFRTDALFINNYEKNDTFLENICRNEIKYVTLHPQKIKTMSLAPYIKKKYLTNYTCENIYPNPKDMVAQSLFDALAFCK